MPTFDPLQPTGNPGPPQAATTPRPAAAPQAHCPETARFTPREADAWMTSLVLQGLDPWLDRDGHCWVRYHRVCRLRWPSSVLGPVNPADRRRLFFRRRAWVISHTREPAPNEPPNAYLYVCRRHDYDFDTLSANSRSKARRGLRRHEVRRIDPGVIGDQGYACYADSRARNNLSPRPRAVFQRFWHGIGASVYPAAWGAFAQGQMAAYLAVQFCGDWVDNCSLSARSSHLKNYPTNAICYRALRDLLTGPHPVAGVSFGLSSLQPDSHLNTLHRFKLSLGFEPMPVVREFEIHPLLRPLIHRGTRSVVHLAEKLAPRNASVQKAKGLLEFLLTGTLPLPGAGTLSMTEVGSEHTGHPDGWEAQQ